MQSFNSSTTQSFEQAIRAESARVTMRVSVLLGASILIGSVLIPSFFVMNSAENATSSAVGSLKNSVATGDSFQIQRTLSSLAEYGQLRTAWVTHLESGREEILFQVGTDKFPESVKINAASFGWDRLKPYVLVHRVLSPTDSLVTFVPIPAKLFLLPGLIFLSLVIVLAALTYRNLRRMLASFVSPVATLTAEVDRLGSGAETARLDQIDFRYHEVERLSGAITDLVLRIEQNQQKLQSLERRKAEFDLARQVAHDIRSPLAALRFVAENPTDSESRGMLSTVIGRIDGIANGLLDRTREVKPAETGAEAASDVEAVDVAAIVSMVIAEKALAHGDVEFDWLSPPETLRAFAQTDKLARVLSNLIENAVEAVQGAPNGRVQVSCASAGAMVTIVIEDNGPGFADSVLQKLGSEPVSVGKAKGNGLGTYDAAQSMVAWGGTIRFGEARPRGAKVTLRLRPSES